MPRPNSHIAAAVVLLCGLLAFVPGLTGYFLADDFVLLSWTRVHSLNEVAGFFDPNVAWFYRPVVKLLYWAGQGIFGLRAAPFHVVSLLLHYANAFMVYRLAVGYLPAGRWAMGLAAGLLFLLNSHHAETVSWVAAVGDLLGLFCVLAALLLFSRYLSSRRGWALGASLGVFALGLLARETAVMLPLLAVGYGISSGRLPSDSERSSWVKRLGVALTLYGALLLTYFAVVTGGRVSAQGPARGGLAFRALNLDSIVLGIFDYVHGLVPWGRSLSALPLDTLKTVVLLEALAVAALFGVLLWQKQRLALFGLVWMMSTPLLFVFFSGPTDRYFYLPSAGYALLVSGLAGWLASGISRWHRIEPARLTRPAAAVVAILLGLVLLAQVRDLLVREGAWREAGKVSGGVFNDVKKAVANPEYSASFYFVDLPAFLDGVPVFQNSLPSALQLIYGNGSLDGFTVTCEEVQSIRLKETKYSRYFFRFKGDGVRELGGGEGCQ